MGNPWLSIVMPVWNGERYLAEALQSIRQQGGGGYEVIAVDDGSSDATPAILRSWEGLLPLRVIRRERGGNWVAATNAGLREAQGVYACFLHQDDLWLPGRLGAIEREASSEPALILHPAVFVGPEGRRLGCWNCPLSPGEVDPRSFAERLLVQNFVAIPTPAFLRTAALRDGGLDESLWYTADWDLWLRLATAGRIRYLRSAFAAFRVHSASQTVVRNDLGERRRQLETVLERHEGNAPGAVRRAARFSLEVNVALAALGGGARPPWRPFLAAFARLGLAGSLRYLRDSRISERVGARLRLRLSEAAGG
jgi:glycosyltransferase involved in cell wall biosynthesis